MNKPVHLDARQVPAQLRAGYRGKRFSAVIGEKVTIPSNAGFWEDGSRETYQLVRMADGAAVEFDNAEAAWKGTSQDREVILEPGFCVLCRSTFRGKDGGMRIYMTPDDAAPLLPAPIELTAHERIVLIATARYKSSYAGRDRYQMARADMVHGNGDRGAVLSDRRDLTEVIPGERFMTRREWDAAKQTLTGRGLLTKIGSITIAGRNAVGH
jgi:hypothetical protein